jgi:hypothetical protein
VDLTEQQKSSIKKKVDKAIDAIQDIKDKGFGCDKTERLLDMLNELNGDVDMGTNYGEE